jgi:DNA-binding MarR family transcriptional regulator
MPKNDLRSELIDVFTRFYNMETLADLMEFCQGELRVLHYLTITQNIDDCIPSKISNALHVTRGRITSALNSLRKKGFVTMDICENDRRKILVRLTETGRNHLRNRKCQAEAFIDHFIHNIGEAKARQFMEILDQTANNMTPERAVQ